MLHTALEYLDRGLSVIPLEPNGKKPLAAALPVKTGADGRPELTRGGAPKHTWEPFQARQPTRDEVEGWFALAPGANLGIVTGAVSGVVVQDLDGAEGLSEAQRRGIPTTPMSRTGKGVHVLYRHPGHPVPNSIKRLPGVDVRGDGGYIVAPPSIHPSGHVYAWNAGLDTPLADAPEWFVSLWTPDAGEEWVRNTLHGDARSYAPISSRNYGERALANELSRLARAEEGNRNNMLVQAAYRMGQLVAGGHLDLELVELKLAMVAQAIGLGDREVRATINSGLNAGMLNPRR